MENKSVSPKHLASFTSFILPLLWYSLIKDSSFNFTDEDIDFIRSYIIAGYYFWWLLILTIIIGVLKYFWLYQISFVWGLINVLFFILTILLLGYLFVVLFLIFSDKKIDLKTFKLEFEYSNIDISVIYFYLPIYNFWLWYRYYDKVKNILYLKESILLWFLVIVFSNTFISELILIFIVLRVVFLSFWIDFIKNNVFLERLFVVNPEEIFAWPIGYIKYIIFKLISKDVVDVNSLILATKKEYEQLIDINELIKSKNKILKLQFLFQYMLLLLILGNSLWQFFQYLPFMYWLGVGLSILYYLLFVSRYLILFYFKKLVRIPVLNEISKLIFVVIK